MLTSTVSDGIARITMCNAPVNALSRQWADLFFKIVGELEARNDWRVLVICSSEKVFCAGGDIKQYAGRLDRNDAGELLATEAAYYQKLFARISALPQPSIAEIGGVAAGGGMELALACDLRIASETTKLGLPEVGVGLLPAGGGTQRMTKLCGLGVAMRLIGGAELITGREALSLGLVEWAVPSSEIATTAAAIAQHLAAQPPEALQAAKACIRAAVDPLTDGFAVELTFPPKLMKTPATQARIRDFLAKQK
ncbi:enoyl-CoA hydratase [Nitrobacteraceae bacterium AZCC 2161]